MSYLTDSRLYTAPEGDGETHDTDAGVMRELTCNTGARWPGPREDAPADEASRADLRFSAEPTGGHGAAEGDNGRFPAWMVDDLARSGISREEAAVLGIRHASPCEIAEVLGFRPPGDSDGYLIPFRDPATGQPLRTRDGSRDFVRVRLHHPAPMPDGPAKYLSPKGAGNRAYVLPEVRVAASAGETIYVTEGEKKALAATGVGIPTIGLTGVWAFTDGETKDLIDDLAPHVASGRAVTFVVDSDAAVNHGIAAAAHRLNQCAANRGCELRVLVLPPHFEGSKEARHPVKAGLDDAIVRDGAEHVRALLATAERIEGNVDDIYVRWLLRFVRACAAEGIRAGLLVDDMVRKGYFDGTAGSVRRRIHDGLAEVFPALNLALQRAVLARLDKEFRDVPPPAHGGKGLKVGKRVAAPGQVERLKIDALQAEIAWCFLPGSSHRSRPYPRNLLELAREWTAPGCAADNSLPRLPLPRPYRPQSVFAAEAGKILKESPSAGVFIRHGQVVEVRLRRFADDVESTGFAVIKSSRLITLIERYAQVGCETKLDDGESKFTPVSMSKATAETLLAAPQFRDQLPVIERVLDVPLPILCPDGPIQFPCRGYDPRFRTYLVQDAPQMREMSRDEALSLIRNLYAEFCFKDEQSRIHAYAALITAFCRGLYGRWNVRTPIMAYRANRERSGKDYAAAIPGLVLEGRRNEDAPLNNDAEELRKKITAALMAGRRRMHFANLRGHLSNATLEAIATAETWTDRVLGESSEVTIPNELELSFSANSGLSYTADLANRLRCIDLHLEVEDANSRRFQRPDLHGWILEHRSEILSALAALVQHWDRAGRPPGPTPFASFARWAEVVGGILVNAGLGDPCLPAVEEGAVDGDQQTRDMKAVFALAHDRFGEDWVSKHRIFELLSGEDVGLFPWLDLTTGGDRTRFGMLLAKFAGRILGGIRLNRDASNIRSQQHRFQFVRVPTTAPSSGLPSVAQASETQVVPADDGHPGHPGHVPGPIIRGPMNYNLPPSHQNDFQVPKVPRVPNERGSGSSVNGVEEAVPAAVSGPVVPVVEGNDLLWTEGVTL